MWPHIVQDPTRQSASQKMALPWVSWWRGRFSETEEDGTINGLDSKAVATNSNPRWRKSFCVATTCNNKPTTD